MKVLAIDFETANSSRSSPCSIGFFMQDIETGAIILEDEMLINPEQEFYDFNIMIHGITPTMVKDKPNFIAVYKRLKELIAEDVILIAHNAAFDMSVLRYSCDRYELPYPSFVYLDTLTLSRTCFAEFPSHRLDYLAERLNIPLLCHHNAAEDAKTCFLLYEQIRSICECRTPVEVANALNIELGQLYQDAYCPCGKISNHVKKKIQNRFDEFSRLLADSQPVIYKDHPFYGKVIVFTGTLLSMPRIAAAEKVLKVGGIFANNLTKSTNILVTGLRESYFYSQKEKSNKLLRAEKLIQQGATLEIISEKDFLEIL